MIDVADSIENTFTAINILITVSELQSLVDPSGGPTGDGGSVQIIGDQINFHRRIASTIDDLPRFHRLHKVLLGGPGGRRRDSHGTPDGERAARRMSNGGPGGKREGRGRSKSHHEFGEGETEKVEGKVRVKKVGGI